MLARTRPLLTACLAALLLGSMLQTVAVGRGQPYPEGHGATAFSPVTIIGASVLALNLNEQVFGWVRYTGDDSPEGAFMGFLSAGTTTLAASIPLGQTLPPGRYYAYAKGINYDRAVSVKLAAGGGEATVPTLDRDWNQYWSTAAPIDVATPTNTLTITLIKDGPADADYKYLLRAIYLTDRPNTVVTARDVIVDLTYPTVMDDSAAKAGNLVENGSFEVGLGHGWGLGPNRAVVLSSIWDQTLAHHGRASAKLPLDASARTYGRDTILLSKVYTVKPNKQYTLSAWIKTAGAATVAGSLRIVNTFSPPEGYTTRHELGEVFVATETWQKVSVTGYLLKYPTSDYQIQIAAEGTPGQFLWVDEVRLEEGGPSDTAYQPHARVELGVVSGQPSNLFYEDETVRAALWAYNSEASATTVQVQYEVYNYLNQRVKQGTLPVTIPAGSAHSTPLDLSVGVRGIFRLVLWIDGRNGVREEVVYAVLPRPQRAGADPDSLIGIHSVFQAAQFDALQKLGIKWDRASSPSGFFRWSLAEPADNQFVWYDEAVQTAADKGITVLGTIGNGSDWPVWADSGGSPNLDKWEEFVGQIVAHYKSQVHYWEISNEPNAPFGSRPGFYAQMLKRAVDAIEREDPTAKIVGMGGSDLRFIQQVIAELEAQYPTWDWKAHIDFLSTHLYPTAEGLAENFREDIIDVYHVPVWNTEIAVWDAGFYLGSNSNFLAWGQNMWPFSDGARYYETSAGAAESLAKSFLHTTGAGLSRYFYYTSGLDASPDYYRTHPTLVEYDDSIRPKGIVYALLAKLFDHSVGLGQVEMTDDNSLAYLFDRQGTPLVALWTTDKTGKSLTLSLPPAQFKVYDTMGNLITLTGSTLSYGRTPVYIEGQGISADTLKTAIGAGVSAARPDSQAPNPSFAATIAQATTSDTFRLRWIAIDETSLPAFIEPNAIVYSYRLAGPAGPGAWSEWAGHTFVDYASLPAGAYSFSVRAKDAAGNESPAISHSFVVSAGQLYELYLPLLERRFRLRGATLAQ